MLDVLKKKKNNKVQNDTNDTNSQKIVDDFIAEVRMPLMM